MGFLDCFRPEWKTEDRVNLLDIEDREDYINASKIHILCIMLENG